MREVNHRQLHSTTTLRERERQILGGLVAIGRIPLQAIRDDLPQARRDGFREFWCVLP